MSQRTLRVLLPILVVALGAVGARAIVAARPQPAKQAPPTVTPLVEVMRASAGPHRYVVEGQGNVQPRISSRLVSEVSGRIVETSENFVEGGFFDAGEVLFRVDDRDARAAAAQAEAQVAAARLALEREKEEARIAREEWERFGQTEEPTSLVLREPQMAQAEANLAAAEAQLARAERDLDRTRVRAPYAGRIRSKSVDLGDVVAPGAMAAQIYAVDHAEIRLPLPDQDLAFLDLPLTQNERGTGPEVVVRGRFAGVENTWRGRVHRTEGEIDPRTRMVTVVVRVPNPYGEHGEAKVPLAIGMFVDAEIQGRRVDDVVVLPREALIDGRRVGVVEDGRLRLHDVEILRSTTEEIVLRSGVADGDQVCLSRLDVMVDGMSVRTRQPGAGGAR